MKKSELDKFYTKPNIAKDLIDKMKLNVNYKDYDTIIEPSAGNGSFYNHLTSINLKKYIIALDLVPENNNIQTQNLFQK